jgi:hypothetical protein
MPRKSAYYLIRTINFHCFMIIALTKLFKKNRTSTLNVKTKVKGNRIRYKKIHITKVFL